MDFGRTIFATCASAAIVLVAPTVARAVPTVSYMPGAQQECTTKDAQRPNDDALRTNASGNNWTQITMQRQLTTRMPRGQNPNDFPNAFQTFPTVYVQPSDNDAGPTVTLTPPSFANGRKTLPLSTCSA